MNLKLLSISLIVFSSIWGPIYSTTQPSYISEYRYLLKTYVTPGIKEGIPTHLVDYQNWATDPAHEKVIQTIKQINPNTLSEKEKTAFWINAYNILTIDLIITTGETESIRNQGSLFRNVWKSHQWTINGTSITLNDIEHSLLRPMEDPRVHMAINCASLSCPDLRLEPYTADNLDEQLNDQVIKFLQNSKKGVYIDNNIIYMSEIFRWFQDDFGDKDEVLVFISRYLDEPIEPSVSSYYFTYDWGLNKR